MITITLNPSWTVIDVRYYPYSTSWEVMALDGDWWYKGVGPDVESAFAQLHLTYSRQLPLGKKRPVSFTQERHIKTPIPELSLDDFNL